VTLLWFSAGIVPLAIVYIAARAFYARHDTMTPVWIGLISVAVCLGSALWLAGTYRVAGLAMATSISGIINAALLLVMLQVRVGGLGGREIARSILRMLPATAVATVATWLTLLLLRGTGMEGRLWQLVLVAVPMAAGGLGFVAIARAMRLHELESAWGLVARRFGRRA
ncbi:MAG: lipid II flippase MurJ, partial [Armatimonadota bacterium]